MFLALMAECILPGVTGEPAPLQHGQAHDLAPGLSVTGNGKLITARIDITVNMLTGDGFGISLVADDRLAIAAANGPAMVDNIGGLFFRRC